MPRRANALLGFPLIDYFPGRSAEPRGAARDAVYAIDRRPADSIETSVGIADNESIDLNLARGR
jgi:hypothetical protein